MAAHFGIGGALAEPLNGDGDAYLHGGRPGLVHPGHQLHDLTHAHRAPEVDVLHGSRHAVRAAETLSGHASADVDPLEQGAGQQCALLAGVGGQDELRHRYNGVLGRAPVPCGLGRRHGPRRGRRRCPRLGRRRGPRLGRCPHLERRRGLCLGRRLRLHCNLDAVRGEARHLAAACLRRGAPKHLQYGLQPAEPVLVQHVRGPLHGPLACSGPGGGQISESVGDALSASLQPEMP
mmetsp:Transcript_102091/g.284230  ORF Transcript_102091/g.284230 Transcript_102091/m.284230 type:complete len:235 (-) Transcript_102091:3-707(-)